MSENYRKMNQSIKTAKEQEWMGNTGRFNKKVPNGNDKGWIGQVPVRHIVQSKLQTPKNSQQQIRSPINNINDSKMTSFSRKIAQSPLDKISNPMSRLSQLSTPQKRPMQLMNDIFRSIGMHHLSASKTYYSRDIEQNLGELLTNKNKLNNYLKKLSSDMTEAPPQVQKNYEILMILLQQLSEADLQVHQDENGLQLCFNRNQLVQKQRQIQKLQKQLEEKNKQTQKIIQDYEGVIRNFNDVIEKLIHQKRN